GQSACHGVRGAPSGADALDHPDVYMVVIGGMITSTLLTLVLVPCAYTYLDDLQNLVLRRRPAAAVLIDRPLGSEAGPAVAMMATPQARLSTLPPSPAENRPRPYLMIAGDWR